MSEQVTSLPHRNLDLLRSLAVLMVLGDHIGIALLPAGWRQSCAMFGRLGVLLFFVHTSLVLMSSLERQGDRSDWVRAFYVRRAFRIYPLAATAIALVLVLGIPAGIPRLNSIVEFRAPTFSTVIANLALVQNLAARPQVLSPLWSLPIEVEMYLLLPFCWLISRRGFSQLAGLLVGLVLAFCIVQYAPVPFVWRFTVFVYGPCFFGGVFAYALLRRRVSAVLPPWVMLAGVFVGAAFLFFSRATDATPVRNWVPCLLIGALLPFIRERSASVVSAAAKKIATYSYGLYLLHIPALWLAFVVFGDSSSLVRALVFLMSLASLAWLAYHAVEAPFVRLGQRIVSKRPDAPSLEILPAA